ncbi:hypothetical protein N7474_003737 [Penicillium riverlandense]|uniref:uncharacterized protein n=1 Tax=Penicillium riverlandense TaxID=1903569 RepID=UPI002548A213|nr:uncharacterized protein N7474_003737 [Penicillium riverlandense]KAJ5818146.1 hypothetical protein N7474_003737 [Penicillium riverlandense]
MADLHDSLSCLQPTTWDVVPKSPDELREYVRDIFKKSRLIAESLPDPPPYENHDPHNGSQPETPHVVPSSARVAETDPEITTLQKQWGKPIKMGGPKDNPLGVHVYKLAGGDGGGHWFGRRSVHEGLPFSRWRNKLSTEFDETLKVNKEKISKGETPDKCIRGIGAEEKVETIEVTEEDGSILGTVTVYHVSAQFPKPTAPRDFVALVITSDTGLQAGGTKQPGRSWIMVSKPCEHPDVPHKDGYIRGEYESVELIREIPVDKTSSGSNTPKSTGGTTPNSKDLSLENDDAELNPVEWIMVTRSDPGGNIPRWMVDKGTPKSVEADAAKFINWAVQEDTPLKKTRSEASSLKFSNRASKAGEMGEQESSEEDSDTESTDTDIQDVHHGLIASIGSLINNGLERFAPQAVLDYMPHHQESPSHPPEGIQIPQSTSKRHSTRDPVNDSESQVEPDHASQSSGMAAPTAEDLVQQTPTQIIQAGKASKPTHNEKELAKLALRKREIQAKLDTVRSELEKMNIPPQHGLSPTRPSKVITNGVDSDSSAVNNRAAEKRSSTPASSSIHQGQREASNSDGQSSTQTPKQDQTPEIPAHMHKAAGYLLSEEAKLLKQIGKIEGNQLKLATKIETRQRKEAERSEKNKSRSETETLRREVEDLRKEVAKLRDERKKWVDLVASLQAENTKLTAAEESKRTSAS